MVKHFPESKPKSLDLCANCDHKYISHLYPTVCNGNSGNCHCKGFRKQSIDIVSMLNKQLKD